MQLREFHKKFGVRPLAASTQEFVPGAILKHSDGSKYRPLGHLRSIISDKDWNTEFQEANLPQGTIEESRRSGGRISVLGITLRGEANKASTVEVVVLRPSVNKLTSLDTLQLLSALKALKKADPNTYAMIDENWVITHGWFAEELRLQFKNEQGGAIEVKIERTDTNLGAEAQLQRKAVGEILITRNRSVPFGFWGFKI